MRRVFSDRPHRFFESRDLSRDRWFPLFPAGLKARFGAQDFPHGMQPSPHPTSDDLWIFGYGSLIWRPGFDFIEKRPALLVGGHRALCVFSHVHRGTPERPGLVMGLDLGGSCHGMAYRVAATQRDETTAYLRAREQVTAVYREATRSVWLGGSARQRVSALVYMVDRSHPQYAGRLSLDEQLRLVRQGHGQSGANRDYVLATVKALEALGWRDHDLHLLAERLHGVHEAHAGA